MTNTNAANQQDAEKIPHKRTLRSFVCRQGRLTPSQQRALETLWPRYGLELSQTPRPLNTLFGRQAEHVLEIGTGNGEALCYAAEHEPSRDFIGVEVHRPGVGRLLNAIEAAQLSNVRVYCADAVEVLHDAIDDGALDEIRIYFPDPWPKKRHHKRRLIQPELTRLLAQKLRPGGQLHLATDWWPYAEHMLTVLDAERTLKNTVGPNATSSRPHWRPQTHFERRGLRLGHGVWDLLYRRQED